MAADVPSSGAEELAHTWRTMSDSAELTCLQMANPLKSGFVAATATAMAIFAGAGLLAADGFVSSARASVSACPEGELPFAPGNEPHMRAGLLCLANNERVARGLQPLSASPALELAAQRHAEDMVARSYVGHTAPSPAPYGPQPRDRAAAAGYPSGYGDASAPWTVAENIFAATEDGTQRYAKPRAAMEAWMASAAHCQAVLAPGFRHLGGAMTRHRSGDAPEGAINTGYHWVMVLGVPGETSPAEGCPAYGLVAPGSSPALPPSSAQPSTASGGSAGGSTSHRAPAATSSALPSGSAPPEMLPAKLRLQRAEVRRGRLDVLARITKHATGRVEISYHSSGTRTRFTAPIANGTIRVDRRLPSSQRRKTTGILTLTYAGNQRVGKDRLRLRAASGKALIKRGTTRIDDSGRLRVSGTISRRAPGVVRIRLGYTATHAGVRFLDYTAEIQSGRWSLAKRLPGRAAKAGGQLSIQYTGFEARRIRGEQLAKAVSR